MSSEDIQSVSELLAKERRARLAAERLLEQKQSELSAANRKLGDHARLLSDEIVVKREEARSLATQAAGLQGENTQVRADLKRANHQAVQAERRLWDALETIKDGFAVFNPKSQLIIANRSYLGIFKDMPSFRPGIRYEDILGLLTTEKMVDTGALSAADWVAMMLDRWRGEHIEPIVIRLWNDMHVKLIDRRARDGDIVSLALDISETIRHEEQLKLERSKANGANRAKSSFLANMSHEIRTPMNGVVAMAEMLCDTALDDEQRLYAETIRSSSETLLVIINDILDYSKIEAEKLTLHPTPFDLERMLHEVVLLLKPYSDEKKLQFLLDFDLALPTFYIGDSGRIRQILTNLMGNAVKFTASGHILVHVGGKPNPQVPSEISLKVTIEDTGIGIPPDLRDHIFGEFNQVEDERNRKFEGTGLGLAITKELVALMKGDIWVDSEHGKGSTFSFSLSLPSEEAPLDMSRLPDAPFGSALVVHDQLIDRMVLEKQLAMLGMEVQIARSGAEVLSGAIGARDLIVCDARLSDIEGIALVRKLRDRGEVAPILLLAANPERISDAADEAGASAVLQKPFRRRDLLRRIMDLAPDPEAGAKIANPPATHPQRKMRVLAAEDNRTNRLVFSKMVQTFAFDLQFANNGRDAVATWESFMPDLIFMDISMPDMDGKEAARTIRHRERELGRAPVPICALTAHAMPEDAGEIYGAGIDHYLTKPLRKTEIHEMILANAPASVTDPNAV